MKLTKIGRYQIESELGRGGMSTVYLAHDPRFNRKVAIKLLPHELLHQPTFRARFEREAKIVAALDFPAIVPVYDYGEEDGQPYLVMRYMAGGTLADRIQKKAMSLAETARILSYLAPALDEAHARNIIHRDLKPSNILFDLQDNPHISDFGTALMTQASIKLTDTGGAVGTPAYMSPEQIRGERTLDGRSDLYSLAIIAYEMLSGQHPFHTTTPIGVAVKHIIDPIPQIRDSNPELPPFCQVIITRAMAKNREDRFATTVEFALALNQAALPQVTAVLQPGSHVSTTNSTRRQTQWRTFQYRQILKSGLLLFMALFIVGSGILWAKGKTTSAVSITAVSPTATTIETASPIPTLVTPQPTATSYPATVVTQTRTAKKTPVPVMEATSTNLGIVVTASQSASIYAQPDTSSSELAIILTGETVVIQGRSENGHWLYVSNDSGVTGFVFASRLGWNGNSDTLPVVQTTIITPLPTTNACENDCPRLKIDAYPLPGGRCEGSIIYTTVFMRGQGGSGVYTYYWDGEQIAGPLTGEGFGFEVNNLSGTVIGRAKVISSDGQSAERELFISDFTCD